MAWVESELEWFVGMFSRQVFPQGSVVGHGVAGECVAIALKHAEQVRECGGAWLTGVWWGMVNRVRHERLMSHYPPSLTVEW